MSSATATYQLALSVVYQNLSITASVAKKTFECKDCGNQISPLANTIFHKSDTPLRSWFFAVYMFSVGKNGVSAKELERALGITYKCAWRIAKQIRSLM